MKKIALINQRYGLEVNGGSEYYTRLIAEKLKIKFDVEIITTKAIDYSDWANHYKADIEVINGIKVNRFPVEHKRAIDFGEYTQFMLSDISHQTPDNEIKWIKDQGPYSPTLIEYIKKSEQNYDVFIFITYLYYPSVMGISNVAEKSIFIPTAHDEPYIHFNIFKELFHLPQAFIFLTDEEKDFVHNTFENQEIPFDVLGVGVDIPDNVNFLRTSKKFHLKQDYIIYAGRIDTGKSCDQLFQFFEMYTKKNKNIILVLVGKAVIEIPLHEQIRYLGFVSDQDKYDLIQGAKLLILPSMFESLSIAVLEALALKTPILVNEKSEVLRGHVIKSNAGLYYSNYLEFEACLHYMLNHPRVHSIMRENGYKYIDLYYNWEKIIDKFSNIIQLVTNKINSI